jgi:hypothetical protein
LPAQQMHLWGQVLLFVKSAKVATPIFRSAAFYPRIPRCRSNPVGEWRECLVYLDQAASAFHVPARAVIGRLERDGAAL